MSEEQGGDKPSPLSYCDERPSEGPPLTPRGWARTCRRREAGPAPGRLPWEQRVEKSQLGPVPRLALHHRRPLQKSQDRRSVLSHREQDAILPASVLFLDRQVELSQKGVEIAADVGENDRLAMNDELLPGQHLDDLLHRAHAA